MSSRAGRVFVIRVGDAVQTCSSRIRAERIRYKLLKPFFEEFVRNVFESREILQVVVHKIPFNVDSFLVTFPRGYDCELVMCDGFVIPCRSYEARLMVLALRQNRFPSLKKLDEWFFNICEMNKLTVYVHEFSDTAAVPAALRPVGSNLSKTSLSS